MLAYRNCTILKLAELSKNKKIYAFGASAIFANFLDKCAVSDIEVEIHGICDNDCTKVNQIYKAGNVEKVIISFDDLRKSIRTSDILLISTMYYVEVAEQLNALIEFDNIECFILPFLESNIRDKSVRLLLNETVSRIPKKIHYCWFGNNPFSDLEKKCIASWHKYCPDYEIIRWDESNYDISKSVEYVKQAYEAKMWAFVSDYARLDIIYNYGGVYFDTDVEILGNIDELLRHEAFAAFHNKRVNTGLGFGGINGNRVIKKWLEDYQDRKFLNSDGSFNKVICPILQTEVLKSMGLKDNNCYQVIDGMAIYPEEYFVGITDGLGGYVPTENTIVTHHFEGTWNPENTKKRLRRIEKNKEFRIYFDKNSCYVK